MSRNSKNNSKAASRVQSGTATPVVLEPLVPITTVLGLNFGGSFSSISLLNKEGLADCIANDDGERQIPTAVSFNGTEEYFGVPARVQLVRNAENTILGFRNLLGKTYDEVKSVKQPYNSAPIVDSNGSPAFTVSINGTPTTLTAHQVSVRYLSVLLSYATDFVGRKITGAVLSVPSDFSAAQIKATVAAAEEAGIRVLQTITEAAASLTAYHLTLVGEEEKKSSGVDRNTLVVDVGGSSTTVTVVAVRDGLFASLASAHDAQLGGDLFDAKLIEWFSKEFTKKTRIPLAATNHRALMKLRLSVEVTKKSLSASTTAPCSVESLEEGMDFHGSINRTRFDLLAGTIYGRIVALVEKALKEAKVDTLHIQEIVLVGGSTKLPTLSDKLLNIFYPSTPSLISSIETDEVIAKGSALQALSLTQTYPLDSPSSLSTFTSSLSESSVLNPSTTSAPIGLVLEDKSFVTLIEELTPLPLRRIFELPIPNGTGSTQILLSLSEGINEVKVEMPEKKKVKSGGGGFFSRASKDDEEEEDEEEEEEEIRTKVLRATKPLIDLVVQVDGKANNKVKSGGGKAVPKLRVTIIVEVGGKGTISAVQLIEGAKVFHASF